MTAEIQKPAIRRRAAGFAERWGGTTSESAEKQTFWNEFFEIFGLDRKLTGQFERHAKRVSTGGVGAMDMLMPGEMAVEHKSADKDLDAAMEQLLDYLPSLSDAESPWLLVVCDFATFYIDNLRTGQSVRFPLGGLAEHIEEFWWLAGHEKIGDEFESEEALNFTATLLMRDLHDNLSDTGYPDHARRVWLTRVLFCAFADDTAVWDRNLFMTYVDQSREDGSDLGGHLATLFQVLNTPDGDRSAGLDEHLAAFTYINGDIFAESIRLPYCNEDIRSALLEVCRFDWSSISPAIFGSLFQEVMTPLERREIGAHYTSEQNILRAIRPLFLDDMEAELKRADTLPKLEAFHERLATATFMDPACGCGNFLVVSYRELRRLELETIRAMQGKRASRRSGTIRTLGERAASLDLILRITLDQFRGIEIEEFPARIASTALYLADHIANREASREFGDYYQRFPIERSPHIHIGNALDMDWDDLGEGQEIDYVFGNPPFVGFVLRTQSQKDDLVRVLGDQASRRVDYVFGWYAKAMDYAADNTRCAFVSTNSVTQGEQAAVLTRLFQDHAANVRFAHRTFAWKSEARGRANVHVVIIGFDQIPTGRRVLVEYPEIDAEGEQRDVKQINSYLVEAPNILIMRRRKPLGDVPELRIGSKPNDAGAVLEQQAAQVALSGCTGNRQRSQANRPDDVPRANHDHHEHRVFDRRSAPMVVRDTAVGDVRQLDEGRRWPIQERSARLSRCGVQHIPVPQIDTTTDRRDRANGFASS